MSAQSMQALEIANRVRAERAQVKRDLRAGTITLAEALEHPALATMPIGDVLCALPRWGDKRARRFLSVWRVHEMRRVVDLTDRQRHVICREIYRRTP